MCEVPGKGRDTTGQGRAIGPNRRNSLEGCSVLGLSTALAKCVSLPARPPSSSASGFSPADQSVAKAERERSEREVVEVGGSERSERVEGGSHAGSGATGAAGTGRTLRTEGRERDGGAAAVPSAGWREVVEELDATEGASHE
jgi:hypothetical protein